jgi:predicted metal-dependent hydrolase
MARRYALQLTIEGLQVPVQVHLEPRLNARFSITRKAVNLRVPLGTTSAVLDHYTSELKAWVERQFQHKPGLKRPFEVRTYATGDTLQVGQRRYWLEVHIANKAAHTAKLIGDTIRLELSTRSAAEHRNKSARQLISRVVAGDFYPEVANRVHEWNTMTVNRPIEGVYLKYHQSKWGSCSSRGNINLSTRLLLTPPEIQDYVILHELAHLVEMNHSHRFWDLVHRYMPDYLQREHWLKQEGRTVDF